jgi:hypothetical protein
VTVISHHYRTPSIHPSNEAAAPSANVDDGARHASKAPRQPEPQGRQASCSLEWSWRIPSSRRTVLKFQSV